MGVDYLLREEKLVINVSGIAAVELSNNLPHLFDKTVCILRLRNLSKRNSIRKSLREREKKMDAILSVGFLSDLEVLINDQFHQGFELVLFFFCFGYVVELNAHYCD